MIDTTNKKDNNRDDKMTESLLIIIPELNAKIRHTKDGRCSIFDLIRAIGQQKDPRNVWKRLTVGYPEVMTKCHYFKFPGQGQRETPITDLQGWLYILALLPGAMGKKYREEAAQLVTRYMKGDESLIDEIKDRRPVTTTSTSTPAPTSSSSPSSIFIPELDIHIRCTEDSHYSIYDLIEAVRSPIPPTQTSLKPAYKIWEPLVLRHQDILRKCHYVKFASKGQRVSPVINLENLPYLLKLLSGYMGGKYKEESAKLTVQYLKGQGQGESEMKHSSATTTTPELIKDSTTSLGDPSPIQQGREFAKYVLELLDGVTLGETPEQDKNLKVGLAISATQAQIPALKEGLEPVKLALVSAAEDENKEAEVYLTPTALGKRLGISPRTMNSRLKSYGLQKKNRDYSKGQPAWLPTEEGKEYSIITIEERKGDDPTQYQHLKWSERVLELFKNPLAA